jgi:hypothetical protein
MKAHEELKQIAMDLVDGKIFSDRHLGESNQSMLGSVFMPIVLGAFSKMTEEELKEGKVSFIYEYLSEAGPMAVNGMPTFFSMRVLNKEETEIMFEYHDKYASLKEEFNKHG